MSYFQQYLTMILIYLNLLRHHIWIQTKWSPSNGVTSLPWIKVSIGTPWFLVSIRYSIRRTSLPGREDVWIPIRCLCRCTGPTYNMSSRVNSGTNYLLSPDILVWNHFPNLYHSMVNEIVRVSNLLLPIIRLMGCSLSTKLMQCNNELYSSTEDCSTTEPELISPISSWLTIVHLNHLLAE